ncbi:carbamoyltransferase [Actinoalloteichus sp. AHMU CJ021]|uniref:carbamoyltransferase family protein n=1 Tax=Actinoalloteichus sp. AHMU CJ021 TaxID=2072503 RepID=UPI000CA01999|nr:carbamoyltransferase [Actinoalloteichus sp. AHMU CJ021]
MTAVLGLNFGTHDSAASLVVDGRVLAAAEEERFTRVKQTKVFPERAVEFCLEAAGLRLADLTRVAYFVDPRLQLLLPVTNARHTFPLSLGSLRSDLAKFDKRRTTLRQARRRVRPVPVTPVRHHVAHAASAFLVSSFEEATVITLDGRGEYETACVYAAGRRLDRRHAVTYPHSIGYFYSMLTRFLGFRPQRDEYKVMGLAAHGGPDLVPAMRRLVSMDTATGRLRLDLDYFDHHRRPSHRRGLFGSRMVDAFGPPRTADQALTDRHRAIAHATQRVLEEVVLGYATHARRITRSRKLCLAGGVALNALANQRIIESDLFDEVFIQPAANDAGTSLGGALHLSDRVRPTGGNHSTLLGPRFSDDDIGQALARARAAGELPETRFAVAAVPDRYRAAAELLRDDHVLGWFQDRMEFGPRALGSRSIIASPAEAGMTARINALIKQREEFRPLAPVVRAEDAADYFELHPAGTRVYPYMLATARVRPGLANRIPSAVHVDGTARLQIADARDYPHFHQLLTEFHDLTGTPVLINTSFNGPDEPIVRTPGDAIRSFVRLGLDALVMGSWLVTRNDPGAR